MDSSPSKVHCQTDQSGKFQFILNCLKMTPGSSFKNVFSLRLKASIMPQYKASLSAFYGCLRFFLSFRGDLVVL